MFRSQPPSACKYQCDHQPLTADQRDKDNVFRMSHLAHQASSRRQASSIILNGPTDYLSHIFCYKKRVEACTLELM